MLFKFGFLTYQTLNPKLLLIILLSVCTQSYAQSNLDSLLTKIDPQKWSATVERKIGNLEDKIIAKSQKTLHRLQKQEERIYRKQLATKDSLAAQAKLAEIKTKYKELEEKLKNHSSTIPAIARQYIAHLDTLKTAFKFLASPPFSTCGEGPGMRDALSKIESLDDKMQQAEEKFFQDFMRKNSMLASLFRMPGDPNDPGYIASLAGLQTRSQVNNLIQQQIAGGGPNAQAQFQQNIQQAQSQLNELKNKITQFGGKGSDDIMPEGFKPNNQKVKSLWKKIELGTNIQTQKATNFFPVTSDLGLSIGLKPNDKTVIGIGASYKLGWGRGWNNIKLSPEGAGLRSFIDWKLKGSFWISGGYEMNYRSEFRSIDVLRDYNAWSRSGLLGISKIVSMNNKLFKKTKIQLLWDFMSYQQIPKGQPMLFRVGYNLK